MSAELRDIEGLLASRIGVDPVSVGTQRIPRAVQQRMNELGLEDLGAYRRWLRQSESELQALIEEVVVSESWFFRDERPFQWFRHYVRACWLADPLRPALHVLSLPCAGGEEPYSIAMTLLDLALPQKRFQIDAVDVSAHRLAIARRGVFSANAFRGSDLAFQARFFREHRQGYELDPSVRATVRFHQASMLDPKLLAGSPPYDILFCRNLLIYLSAIARASVVAAIDRLLAPDGVLFVGHADRLDWVGMEPKFTPVGDPGCFAYRRSVAENTGSSQVPSEPARPISGAITAANISAGTFTAGALSAGNQEILSPVTALDTRPALLDQATELANQGRFNEAVAVCEQHLRQKGLSPSAYYLMGMICQAAGDRQRAEKCFHKTVYLDPRHDEALLALALLAERRGDRRAAAVFRRRAERSATVSTKRAN